MHMCVCACVCVCKCTCALNSKYLYCNKAKFRFIQTYKAPLCIKDSSGRRASSSTYTRSFANTHSVLVLWFSILQVLIGPKDNKTKETWLLVLWKSVCWDIPTCTQINPILKWVCYRHMPKCTRTYTEEASCVVDKAKECSLLCNKSLQTR